MNWIRCIRIFLLVLIIIGLGLLATQSMWVPKVINMILKNDSKGQQIPIVSNDQVKTINSDSFEWCMANGGKDETPSYLTIKTCVLNNKVYSQNCVGNNKYFVISKDKMGEVGSDILVKYKSSDNQTISCDYSVRSGDFVITGDAQYILALENNFLITDSGTGPYPRSLTIYDLNTRKKNYHDTYSGVTSIQNNTIDYWMETAQTVTDKNCPNFKNWEAGGLGSAIESHVSLNISTLTKTELGEYRCSSRQ